MNGIGGPRQTGMSLVEVLVALLVLGIGVMGYAALQLNAVKMTEDTYARSQALAIARDLVERMRSNIEAADSYTAASAWTGDPVAQSCFAATPDATARLCTPANMAAADIYQIRQTAQTMLPNGAVSVASCSEVTCVTVAWSQTTPANCDETEIVDGKRGTNASCIVLPFNPGG